MHPLPSIRQHLALCLWQGVALRKGLLEGFKRHWLNRWTLGLVLIVAMAPWGLGMQAWAAEGDFLSVCRRYGSSHVNKGKSQPPAALLMAALRNQLGGQDCADIARRLKDARALYLNGLGLEDLRPLSGATALEELDLSDNLLSDLTPLASLPSLRHLWLGENHISDVTPLGGLEHLELLDIEDNQLESLLPLAHLRHLKALDASRNRINALPTFCIDRTPQLDRMPALTAGSSLCPAFVFLAHNRIRDPQPLWALSPWAHLSLPPRGSSSLRKPATALPEAPDWNSLFDLAYGQGTYFRKINLDGNPLSLAPWDGGCTPPHDLGLLQPFLDARALPLYK